MEEWKHKAIFVIWMGVTLGFFGVATWNVFHVARRHDVRPRNFSREGWGVFYKRVFLHAFADLATQRDAQLTVFDYLAMTA